MVGKRVPLLAPTSPLEERRTVGKKSRLAPAYLPAGGADWGVGTVGKKSPLAPACLPGGGAEDDGKKSPLAPAYLPAGGAEDGGKINNGAF